MNEAGNSRQGHKLNEEAPLWSSAPLDGDHDAILASLERSAPVRLMATMKDVVVALAEEPVAEAARRADEQRFDFLPVRERTGGAIIGLFHRSDVHDAHPTCVAKVMKPLSGDILIGADAPLLDFVHAADTHPCQLVLDRKGIEGLVTLSDIQRLPVRTVLFSLFIHLELLLTDALRARLGPNRLPFDLLPPDRAKGAAKRWRKAQQGDMDRDPFNALQFTDKRMLAVQCGLLGLEPDCIDDDLRRIEGDLRTPLAHGKDFAITEQSAFKVVRASRLVRDWIRRIRDGQPRQTDPAP